MSAQGGEFIVPCEDLTFDRAVGILVGAATTTTPFVVAASREVIEAFANRQPEQYADFSAQAARLTGVTALRAAELPAPQEPPQSTEEAPIHEAA